MDKVPITYDAIFETLVREKSREELQKLSPTFFEDLTNYMAEKKKTVNSDATDPFSLEEKERAAKQLQNVTRMINELYERREKKILTIGIIRSRTGADIVDTSALLSEEKMLFESMVAQLDYYRTNILFKVLNAKPTTVDEKKVEAEKRTADREKNTKLVRFLYAVPKFVGKELEIYGPFTEEDIASLPNEIADILIEKGRAEEIS